MFIRVTSRKVKDYFVSHWSPSIYVLLKIFFTLAFVSICYFSWSNIFCKGIRNPIKIMFFFLPFLWSIMSIVNALFWVNLLRQCSLHLQLRFLNFKTKMNMPVIRYPTLSLQGIMTACCGLAYQKKLLPLFQNNWSSRFVLSQTC